MLRRGLCAAAVVALLTTGSAWAGGIDEVLELGGWTLSGGESTTITVEVEENGNPVIGFTFSGFYEDDGVGGGWASDLNMQLTTPGGSTHSYGGFDNPGELWDFDGAESDAPGTYTSDHFPWKGDGIEKGGTWNFVFTNDFDANGPLTWTDVTITLHKVPAPGAFALLGLALARGKSRRRRA